MTRIRAFALTRRGLKLLVRSGLGLVLLLGALNRSAAGDVRQELIVAGSGSDNIVRFDLTTGEATVIARLANGSKPWALAADAQGELFVGLRGNGKNVVQLKRHRPLESGGALTADDVTPRIGRYGPGKMAFDSRGLLNVAADTERAIQRYDVERRKLVETIPTGRKANILGLAIANDSLFAAEYFQGSVLRIDLAADPASSSSLIAGSERLDRPYGLAVGRPGRLFVTNLGSDLVQEFDLRTGRFMRTFLDVKTLGASGVHDLLYDAVGDRYFLTSGDTVYELCPEGSLIARYESPALANAQGIVCRLVRN